VCLLQLPWIGWNLNAIAEEISNIKSDNCDKTGWGFKDLKKEIPIDENIEPGSIKAIIEVSFTTTSLFYTHLQIE
jgi:hypothetical protein